MVVPEASSRSYMDDFYTIPDVDHLTVCQPGSKQSSGFEKLFDFVGSVLKQDQNRVSTKIKLSVEDVGLDVQVKKILETLRDERRLGMVGIGGIGKSTLARAIFDTISERFDYTCFLHGVKTSIGVGEDSKLQDLILDKLCHNGHLVDREFCWSTLKGKKVLIVLDDADNESQVMVMTESDGFSKDSRVIVTARESQFLKQQDFFTILVQPLSHDDSKRLFCLHAFKGEVAAKGYEERVTKFATKCGGLPLALKIAGGYLYGQGKDKNEREKAEVWDGAFIKLKQAKSIDGKKQDGLWSILKICYENLADQEQEMFLDVATCFHGEVWKDVLEAWRVCSWSRESQVAGWNNLVDRGMVRKDYGFIWMHEVLRDLGRRIACPDDKNVASHTRVFDVRLTKQLSNQEKAPIKVLNITHAYLEDVHIGFLGGLKELEILWLGGCSFNWLESMGDVFPPQIVFLRIMVCCPQDFVALQHRLGGLPSCRSICLDLYDMDGGNDRLEHLLGSLGQLYQLEHLRLQGLRPKFIYRTDSHHYQDWNRHGCSSLKTLPAKFGELSQLRHLELHGCILLKTLPANFGELSQLRHLELHGCRSLKTLPANFGELSQLWHLELHGCSSLKVLPANFGELSQLRHLELHGCSSLKMLPANFGELSQLRHLELGCDILTALPAKIGKLSQLEHLKLHDCYNLTTLPIEFGELHQLQRLQLHGCISLKMLPAEFGELHQLQRLQLIGCISLKTLPAEFGELSQLRHLQLDECNSLETLPVEFGKLSQLWHLELRGCSLLKTLPAEFGELSQLRHLELHGCSSLKTLPAEFGELTQLWHLELHGCSSLKTLPAEFGELSQLRHLELSNFEKLTTLPTWFGELSQLQHLDLRGCKNLTKLPAEFGKLQGLRHLHVDCCGLQELPGSFVQLEALEELKIEYCHHLRIRLSCLWDLLHLERLEISSCEKIDGWKELVDLSFTQYCWYDKGPSSNGTIISSSSNGTISSPSSNVTIRCLRDFTMADLHLAKIFNCKESGVIVRNLSSNDDFIFHARHSSYSDQEHRAYNSYCHIGNLATLPERRGQVQALQMLTIENGGLPELEVLWQFQELKILVFESIAPHLEDLEDFKLDLFNQLTALLATLGHLRSLETLIIRGCHRLTELPQALGQLGALRKLQIERCYWLKALPDTLGELGALQDLRIADCLGLKALPNTLGQLGALQKLHIVECPGLEVLPDTLGQLVALQELLLEWCPGLETLPDALGQLRALQELSIKACPGLIALPDTLGQLGVLQKLHIEKCPGLEALPHTLGQLGACQARHVEVWQEYIRVFPTMLDDLPSLEDS